MAKTRLKQNEEIMSLVNAAATRNAPANSLFRSFCSPQPTQHTCTSSRWQRVLAVVMIGCLVMFIGVSLERDSATGDVQLKLHRGQKIRPATVAKTNTNDTIHGGSTNNAVTSEIDCHAKCMSDTVNEAAMASQLAKFDGHDLTNPTAMQSRLQGFRDQWIEGLKKDYGEDHYRAIFEPLLPGDNPKTRVHVGKHRAFVDPNRLPRGGQKYEEVQGREGPAWYRMVRKWTIKVLQVQLNMLEEQIGGGSTSCPETCRSPTASSATGSESGSDAHRNGVYGTYRWANGGHSASAGHGNFYRESYTAILGRDLQPILKEIGLDFQVRNYAMGGTESGEEVGLCFNSIFGKDIDSITWDYGMTDGREFWKIINYAYSAARLALLKGNGSHPGSIPHRPSLMVFHQDDEQNPVLQSLQSLGLPLLAMDRHFQKEKMMPGFPDMFGMSDVEIASSPKYVQYFKCQEKTESGDPGCNEFKFNHTYCPERVGQNTWHPGWRYHALMGHTVAFTILELITQALDSLSASEPDTTETPQQKHARLLLLLQTLDAKEQQDYENIFMSPLPRDLEQYFEDSLWKGDEKDANKEAMKDLPLFETMVKDFHFCHTAMIPSEMRYRGLLTENYNETGKAKSYDHYEHGVMITKVMAVETDDTKNTSYTDPHPGHADQMVLTSSGEDWDEETCEDLTRIDHKDFFYISSKEGWRTLTIPNDSERKYYTEFSTETSKGWIIICLSVCDWNNCDRGDIRNSVADGSLDAQEFGKLHMELNGVKVTGVNCMNRCCALRHDDTDASQRFVWKPNAEGKYEFRTMISDATEYSYAKFSSFILL